MGNKYLKLSFYGFLTWMIPFVTAFFFYTAEGELTIDVFLFKSIMIVVGSISASALLISYFKSVRTEYLKEGLILGFVWLGINLLLDLVILLPMSGMSMGDYFAQIGLRYLVIPVMAITIGKVMENKF